MNGQELTKSERLAVAEFLNSADLELLTGIPSSNWRKWASAGTGPHSFKVGKRRLWKKSTVMAWLEEREAAPA
ncbi:MAG: helix-turn-helix domain-containing protein [Mycobacterium sp.]